MKLPIYDISGDKEKSVNLVDRVFGVKPNPRTIAHAARVQEFNRHGSVAHTKTKSEVSGGGKKPWRQKGTGRARAGSNRSPIWKGGGITHGPRNQKNPKLVLPKKIRVLARNMALSQKADSGSLIILGSKNFNRKSFIKFIEKLKIDDKKIMFVSQKGDAAMIKSVRNLTQVATIGVNSLNLLDLLNCDVVIWLESALDDYKNKTRTSPVKKISKPLKNKKS